MKLNLRSAENQINLAQFSLDMLSVKWDRTIMKMNLRAENEIIQSVFNLCIDQQKCLPFGTIELLEHFLSPHFWNKLLTMSINLEK